VHFRHISTKVYPKNVKQHFDWVGARAQWRNWWGSRRQMPPWQLRCGPLF